MITINLLPEAYRAPQTTSVQQLYRSPLLIGASVLLIGGLVALQGMVQVRQVELKRVRVRLEALQAQKRDVDGVKATVQKLRDQQGAFAGLSAQRSQWAKRLGLLPEVTPEGVWFTELSFDYQKGLTLQGAAISQGGDEMLQIGRMAQELKANPVFSTLVRDIQIESMKREQDGEIEVIHFTLSGSIVSLPAVEPSS